jgi:hypothetical protein
LKLQQDGVISIFTHCTNNMVRKPPLSCGNGIF